MSHPSRRRVGRVFAALVALALAAPPAAAQAQNGSEEGSSPILIDRVAAVAGDSVILYSDMMMRATPMLQNLRGISDPEERERRRADIEERVLDEMISEELMIQAAEESNIEISEEEIDTAIQEIQRENDLSRQELEEALKGQGYTMSSYRDDLERQMLRMRAQNMLVRPRVNVSRENVRARYEEMEGESSEASRVRLRHILVEVDEDASEEEQQAAQNRAGKLVQKAREGSAFEELAREHSDDTATRSEGGDLGWIERGSLATEWEDIVFAMDEGEVRGPVTGPRGLHVFYIDEREREEVPSFEEAEESLKEELFQEEMERETQSWLEELRKDAHIEVKLGM